MATRHQILKNLLLRSQWMDFKTFFTEMFFYQLSIKFTYIMMISQKTWPPGGGVSFPYMEYIEKTFRFHLLLIRLTDFSKIWHKVTLAYSVSCVYKISSSAVRSSEHPSAFSIHLFSEITCLISTKLCQKYQCAGGTN